MSNSTGEGEGAAPPEETKQATGGAAAPGAPSGTAIADKSKAEVKHADVALAKGDQSKDALKRKLEELSAQLDALASEVVVAGEWGIFCTGSEVANGAQQPGIYAVLSRAYSSLAAEKPVEVEQALLEGRAALNCALCDQWLWRVNNQYGLLPILFTVFFTAATYQFVFGVMLGLSIPEAIKHPAFAGMIGAVLRSLYWLHFQIGKGLLRPRWFMSFIATPIIGVILGWIVSLLIGALALLASGNANVQTDWRTVSLLAAFAGFKWEWAIAWLEDSAKAIQARIKEKPSAKPKG
jgi:hypothetical protein